jgi:hypothetical protein
MNGRVGKLARCAIYTRKSSEHNLDLAFSSLDAQREACEAYIKSQAHEADDARSREVRLCHSSWEADEQSGLGRRGAGGAKGRGQGECEPAKHAPDAEPGKCVTGAGAHTASRNEKRFAVTHPGGSRMPELGPYGSVRGALSNERPYGDLRNVAASYPFERAQDLRGSSRILAAETIRV